MPKPRTRPVVKIKPSTHVPTKAEMDEDMGVPISLEALGKVEDDSE